MKSLAPALDRGIDVIEFMASYSEPLTFSEIQDALPIPRASLTRILNVLHNRGLIDKMQETGRYRLGMKLLYIGNHIQDKISLRTVAFPYMQRLAQLTREMVELSTLDQDQLVKIDQIEGVGDVRLYSRVGSAYPYFHVTAVGKLYLELPFFPGGNTDQSVYHLEEAVRLGPDYAENYLGLAQAYYAQNNPIFARKTLLTLMRLTDNVADDEDLLELRKKGQELINKLPSD